MLAGRLTVDAGRLKLTVTLLENIMESFRTLKSFIFYFNIKIFLIKLKIIFVRL